MADLTVILTGQQAISNPTTWGTSSQYGQGYWGTGGDILDVVALNEQGWGSDTYGTENWGESGFALTLSGLSVTASVGEPTIERYPGWGTLNWGENGWGDVLEATEVPTGQQATASVGAITPADVVGLTGLSATASCPTQLDIPEQIVGVGATSSVGSITPADAVGLTGLSATASVGAITPADVVGISGVSATAEVGDGVTVSDAQVFTIGSAGVGTTGIGSVITETAYTLSGQSMTSAVGSISPEDVVGLTGREAVSAVGNVAPLGYANVDIDGNTSYNDVDVSGNTSYTDVTHAA